MFSQDTHPKAARKLVELLRQSTPAKRFSRTRSLTASTMAASFRNFTRLNPDVAEDELKRRFIKLCHGVTIPVPKSGTSNE